MMMHLEWSVLVLVLVTQVGSNQINYGQWMVPWRIVFEDGNGNVAVSPQSIQLHSTPLHSTSLHFTSLHFTPHPPRRVGNGIE